MEFELCLAIGTGNLALLVVDLRVVVTVVLVLYYLTHHSPVWVLGGGVNIQYI